MMRDRAQDIESVLYSITVLVKKSELYEEVIFPEDGLGTGLAKMKETSPIAYRLMNAAIKELFGIDLTQSKGKIYTGDTTTHTD